MFTCLYIDVIDSEFDIYYGSFYYKGTFSFFALPIYTYLAVLPGSDSTSLSNSVRIFLALSKVIGAPSRIYSNCSAVKRRLMHDSSLISLFNNN